MKPHIEFKVRRGAPTPPAPFWEEILTEKSGASAEAHPEITRLLARYAIPVWVTRGYAPSGAEWSPTEIASGLNRIYRLVLQENRTVPAELIRNIELLPFIEYAHVGRVGKAELPDALPAQMSAATDRKSREAIYLEQAQQFSQGDPSVTIAVLDTGIHSSHPEFRERLLPGRDFVDIIDGAESFFGDYLAADDDPADEVGHGTHVTGILVGKGIAMPSGVVPRCRILPVRVLGAMRQGEKRVGAGLVDNINVAIKWAVDQGADVINMSLGVRHTGGGLPHAEVVDYALRNGVTIVAAAGNDGRERFYYPGALEGVIAVGAFDESGEVAPFSTFGAQVSFVAPGTNIFSSYLDDEYAFSTGTSHATPFVAGAAAMLKSYARQARGVRLTDRQVKHVLKHTADRVDTRFKDRKAGFGRLNLLDAMRLLEHKLN